MTEKLPIKWETLRNKTAIITGGASGLGLATALQWAEHGAYVALADRDEAAGQKAVTEMTAKGYNVTFVQCDTTDWQSSVAAFKHAVQFGPRKTLDIAALYAGIGGDSANLFHLVRKDNPQVSMDIDPVESDPRILQINLDGVVKSTKLALHYFRLPAVEGSPEVTGRKSLFLVSSLAGYCDYDPTHYSTSKFGVRGLFRSLRIAARDPANNFAVSECAPGYHGTPMVMNFNAGDGIRQKKVEAARDAGFLAPIEHVANCASLCVTNEQANCRSFLTIPSGFYDIGEDLMDGYGGATLTRHLNESGYIKAGFVS